MEQDLVRYSRAGDAFHYRWAARRCLKLLDSGSGLLEVLVEGSKESKLGGECSIDLSEYSKCGKISYFQLKHTTTQKNIPFSFTHLSDTLERFMQRFSDNKKASVKFYFVTNRPVSNQLKNAITKIANGEGNKTTYLGKLQKLANLAPEEIRLFCQHLYIDDTEGDFDLQKRQLSNETTPYLSSSAESIELDSLIALISDKVLPSSTDNEVVPITKEDVLMRFGVNSERALFPAPPLFDIVDVAQKREFHDDLLNKINQNDSPLIIQASGGVGKTVIAQQIVQDILFPNRAVLYDCFGNGSYRSPSEPRHPARVALVQIANELARDVLCSPLIPRPHDRDSDLFSAFKDRLTQAISNLKKSNPKAKLIILLDAADNSEMAAMEKNEAGFAKLLLRENLPESCKIILFSRPGKGRVKLLEPSQSTEYYDLPSFTPPESHQHLINVFPQATELESTEFHKLSQGNPRVQAFALSERTRDVNALLEWLGPNPITVDDLIAKQLKTAVSNLKDNCPQATKLQISRICCCLATLPPCIPKSVLASASQLETADIDSFVSDLGRPLWISENLVHFRDEPTESWFRDEFAAHKEQISEIIDLLMPLSEKSAYVAKSLPSLLHQAGQFDKLLSLVLLDQGLPKITNVAELKEISIERTQFALKAALKEGRTVDSYKLAFKAAEEMAGTERVDALLANHSDFIASCLSSPSVHELALSRKFSANWNGSENIYSALLLSEQTDYRGEALSYLRSSRQWIRSFREKIRAKKKHQNKTSGFTPGPRFEISELSAMARAILNLEGVSEAVCFLSSWLPKTSAYELTYKLTEGLIDSNRIDDVQAILVAGEKQPYIVIACCEQLLKACIIPAKAPLKYSLKKFASTKKLIELPQIHDRTNYIPLIAFCEAAVANKYKKKEIKKILNKICNKVYWQDISNYSSEPRAIFFRAYSLRIALNNLTDYKETAIWNEIISKDDSTSQTGREEMSQIFGKYLFPWYIRRSYTLLNRIADTDIPKTPTSQELSHHGHDAHPIGYEISSVWIEILGLNKQTPAKELELVNTQLLSKPWERLHLLDALQLARIAFRHDHLAFLRDQIEEFCHTLIDLTAKDPEEEVSESLAIFAKAIFPYSKADATALFSSAIDVTSKFGHELNDRWHVILAVARQSATGDEIPKSLGQRFFRCAEVVSVNVSREKYWDRCETFALGVELNPSVAFAAWSRWRDRRLITWRPTLLSMARRSIKKKIFPASTIWPLTGFLECNQSAELHRDCILLTTDQKNKSSLQEYAVRDLRLAQASRENFQVLSTVIKSLDVESITVKGDDEIIYDSSTAPSEVSPDEIEFDSKLEELFKASSPLTRKGLHKSIVEYKNLTSIRYADRFWSSLTKKIPRSERIQFFDNLLTAPKFDFYDLEHLLSSIQDWKKSIAIREKWSDLLEPLGSRFSSRFFSLYNYEYSVGGGRISKIDYSTLQKGAIKAFAESSNLYGHSTLLGFVTQEAEKLHSNEATELLDFILSRIETHISSDFGEGIVELNEDSLSPVSGMIWSCLGSPYSSERWQAMHCVRRFAITKNQSEISDLINRMENETVGSFGCSEYEFYLLHARLYLLTALNRVAKDNCELLVKHADIFKSMAFKKPVHVLIQKTAAEISLSISQISPSSFSSEIVEKLQCIGHSPFPLEEIANHSNYKGAPWSSPVTPKGETPHHFENDFGWYWFPNLRDLFNVGQHHIEYVAKDFINHSLGKSSDSSFGWLKDKRSSSRYNERSRSQNFHHSHGSYPTADTLEFYCEYHSYHHAAARLLEKTAITVEKSSCYYGENPFEQWLARHSLTLIDGTWLSDHRDPAPLTRKLSKQNSDTKTNWVQDVTDTDFENIIHHSFKDDDWVIINGHWTHTSSSSIETIKVSSSMVSPKTSDALARFLTSQDSPYDFYFPTYRDEDDAIENLPFHLQGIILSNSEESHSLQAQDPYAGNLPYPRIQIAPKYAKILNLEVDSNYRTWCNLSSQSPSIKSEIWNNQGDETGKTYSSGKRIGGEVNQFTELCKKLSMDMIFCIEIHRSNESGSYHDSKETDKEKRRGTHFKILILSADGKFRTTTNH